MITIIGNELLGDIAIIMLKDLTKEQAAKIGNLFVKDHPNIPTAVFINNKFSWGFKINITT